MERNMMVMKKPELRGNIKMYVHKRTEWQTPAKLDYKILTARIQDAWRAHNKNKIVVIEKPINTEVNNQKKLSQTVSQNEDM